MSAILIAIGAAAAVGGSILANTNVKERTIAGADPKNLEAAIARARGSFGENLDSVTQQSRRSLTQILSESGGVDGGAAVSGLESINRSFGEAIAAFEAQLAMAEVQGMASRRVGPKKSMLNIIGEGISRGGGSLAQAGILGGSGGGGSSSGGGGF